MGGSTARHDKCTHSLSTTHDLTLSLARSLVRSILQELRNGNSENLASLKKNMERRLTKVLVTANQNSGGGGNEDDKPAATHKKLDICLACNRPLGKSVSLNASNTFFGPKNEINRRTSMLVAFEADSRRRMSSIKDKLPARKTLYKSGFNMPLVEGQQGNIWGDDLGGGRLEEVNNTLKKMEIKESDPVKAPDYRVPPPEIIANHKHHPGTISPDMLGKQVSKDWLKVTNGNSNSNININNTPEARKNIQQQRTSAAMALHSSPVVKGQRGKSLHIIKNSASQKVIDGGRGSPTNDKGLLPEIGVSRPTINVKIPK